MTSSDFSSSAAQRPYALRAAVGLWCALAAFLLVQAGMAWGGFEQLRTRLVEQQGMPAAQADEVVRSGLLFYSLVAFVLAAGYAGLAWLMWRRYAWARTAVTVEAMLHMLVVLGTAALSAANLIVLVLTVAAWACCWRRTSTEWLVGDRA